MTGALAVLLPLASAGFLAAAARFRSLVSTLLLGYLALAACTVGGVLVLSPLRDVRRGPLVLVEALLLAGAVAVWVARGRPGLPFGGARAALRAVLGRPETALFLAAVALMLGYELFLALTVPPNNYAPKPVARRFAPKYFRQMSSVRSYPDGYAVAGLGTFPAASAPPAGA